MELNTAIANNGAERETRAGIGETSASGAHFGQGGGGENVAAGDVASASAWNCAGAHHVSASRARPGGMERKPRARDKTLPARQLRQPTPAGRLDPSAPRAFPGAPCRPDSSQTGAVSPRVEGAPI